MTRDPASCPPWGPLLDPVRRDLGSGAAPRDPAVLADAHGALQRCRAATRALPPPADPAWTMLLALFAAQARGERPSVSALCAQSGAPLTTAFRLLVRMEDRRMIARVVDLRDHRRSLVSLEDETRLAMIDALGAFLAALQEGPG